MSMKPVLSHIEIALLKIKDWGSGDFFEAGSTATWESCGHEFNYEEIEKND